MSESEEELKIEVKEEDAKDIKPSTSGSISFPTEAKFSNIKNKHVRGQQFQKYKREQKKVQCFFLDNHKTLRLLNIF